MKKELLEKIEELHEAEKYQEIIDLIERLPGEELDTELIGELGRAYNNIEEYEKGLEILKGIKTEVGDTALWNWRIGYSYFFLEEYTKAEKHFLKVYELEPDNENACDFLVGTYIALGKIEDEKGNYEKALGYALIAYELDRDDVHSLSQVGWLYSYMGKYEEGLPFLLRAEELGRDDEWIKTEIAMNLGRSGKLNKGIEKLQESLTMVDETDIDRRVLINSEIGWYYGKLEEPQPEEALKYLNIAKDLGREDEWLYSQIAYQLSYNPKTKKEALEYYDKVIELGRNDAWIFEMRGLVLLDLKRYEEALDSFKKVSDLNDDSWYLYSMGGYLRNLGRYEDAIEVLLESRKLSLAEEDVVDGEDFELAYCYIGIGDKENAQKYLDLARDSVIKEGALDEYIKEDIEEIEKGILSLDN